MATSIRKLPQIGTRFIAAAALAVSLAVLPGLASATQKYGHEDRTAQRITDMHVKLKITPAQEELWAKVAQTMSENAKLMDSLTQARVEHAREMTAVDDLKSYGEITDAHAAGIKTLMPVFASLYESMSDSQKKEADVLFRHGDRKHHGHKHGEMGTPGK
jgi:hypothetical protein